MWIGVIHHVCGEHEWENGECSHGQLTEVEEGKGDFSQRLESSGGVAQNSI